MKSIFFILTALILLMPALGQEIVGKEIVGIYSDLRSCEVNVDGAVSGDLLSVDLSASGRPVQSRRLPLDGPGTWIISWEGVPSKEGSYSVRAALSKNGTTLSEKSFDFHHGGRVPVRFDVRDFQADSRGIHLQIYSQDMATVEIYHMLVRDGKALYVARERSQPISDGVRKIDLDWKQLLENGEQYLGRVKIVETGSGQMRSFMSPFTAHEDARITDTYEDETGASATILGESLVPLSGRLNFTLYSDGVPLASHEKGTPVILKDDDETVEISWNLDPALYRLKIQLLGADGELIDFTEKVIEARSRPDLKAVRAEEPESSSQNMVLALAGVLALVGLVYLIRRRS